MARAWAYFDTSALLKRYLEEPGYELARELLERYRIASSVITPVEAVSGLRRRCNRGEIDTKQFDSILAKLRSERTVWELVRMGTNVCDRAEDIVRQTGIRTLDALHLASALLFQAETGTQSPFITADRQQHAAALFLGMTALLVGA